MSRWWRAYDDALNDPKVQRLPGDLFKTWFNVLCIASKHDGVLPDIATIAFMLRCDEQKAQIDLDELIALGLIDQAGTSLQPHNWSGRQHKSDVSTERVQRFRKRHETVSVTPPDTEQIETERTDARASLSKFRRDVTALYAKHFPSELPPDTNLCDVWEAQGLDAKLCLAAIAENFERSKKFKSLQYFSRMLAELHEKKVDVAPVTPEAERRAHWSMLEAEKRTGRWPSNRTPKSDIPAALIAEFESQHSPIS